MKDTLLRWGFQNTKIDSSLFVLRENDHIILLLIYVDDIIITRSNNNSLKTFIIAFSLKDIGILHYLLGIEVDKDVGGMYLKQTKYIRDLLKKFNIEKASSCPTPMVTGKQFTTKGKLIANPILYRQAIGALQYLTNTRLDITFFVTNSANI